MQLGSPRHIQNRLCVCFVCFVLLLLFVYFVCLFAFVHICVCLIFMFFLFVCMCSFVYVCYFRCLYVSVCLNVFACFLMHSFVYISFFSLLYPCALFKCVCFFPCFKSYLRVCVFVCTFDYVMISEQITWTVPKSQLTKSTKPFRLPSQQWFVQAREINHWMT